MKYKQTIYCDVKNSFTTYFISLECPVGPEPCKDEPPQGYRVKETGME